MKRLLQYSVTFIIMTVLAGCGFQPRGMTHIPSELTALNLYTDELDDSTLTILKERLVKSGITVYDAEETFNQSIPTLYLTKERLSQRTLSLQRSESRTNSGEFELINEVDIELQDAEGKHLIAPDTISDRKVYYNDVTRVIGKESEAELYRKELKQSIVRKILLRLESMDGLIK